MSTRKLRALCLEIGLLGQIDGAERIIPLAGLIAFTA